MFVPSYIKLLNSGELIRRAEAALQILNECRSCPRNCLSDRIAGTYGYCLSGYLPVVSSYTSHFGEEPVLSGTNGAGNIFFGNCNLRCVFCQNYEISQNYKAENKNSVSFEQLAAIMLELQSKNCHNIGLVSPTHFAPQILQSISIAAAQGLNIPLIYNTNGYDTVEILKLFDGIADIYLPDLKYGNNQYAKTYSYADNYFDHAKEAIKEMYRQVGPDLVYQGSIVVRGLIIRHLVLPNDLSESEKVFEFIADELDPGVHVSLMSQYFPVNKAEKDFLLNRPLRVSEYEKTLDLMDKYGLKNGWIQELESNDYYRPEFNKDRNNPFES